MDNTTPAALRKAVNSIFLKAIWVTEIGFERCVFIEMPELMASNGQGTMATDGRVVYYHPSCLKWQAAFIEGVIVHEWLHGALMHPERFAVLPEKNHKVANIAMDAIVNAMCIEWGFKLPEGAIDMPEGRTHTFEQLYAKLMGKKKQGPEPQKGKGKGGDGQGESEGDQGGDSGGDSEGEGEGEGSGDKDDAGQDQEGEGKGGGDDEKEGDGDEEGKGKSGSGNSAKDAKPEPAKGPPKPTLGERDIHKAPSRGSQAEDKAAEERGNAAIVRAVATAKAHGKDPLGLGLAVAGWGESKVSWREQLAAYATQRSNEDWSYMKTNGSYAAMNVIVPGRYSKTIGDIIVVRDTSGSLYSRQKEVMTEVAGIITQCNPTRVIIIDCDAEVHRVLEFEPWMPLPTDALGGGGTDFRPAFEEVAKRYPDVGLMVFVTDLMGDFPSSPPPYPVIWCGIENGNLKPPFGDFVEVAD
jgi:predicted metal-dependent peptidase